MKYRRFDICAALAALSLGSAGCAPTHQDMMTFLDAREHVSSGGNYQLAPSDLINIYAPHAPEVDASVRIQPNGSVHLKLLGDVRLAGLTVREAAAKLQNELQAYYREPVVHVETEHTNNVFYLFGEVGEGSNDQGGRVQNVTGRDSIINVLTRYPPSRNAWLSQIKVIRPGKSTAENQEMVIDYFKMMTTGDMRQNILIQEGDIVYVPPTPLAWVGYRIAELLQPVSPVLAAYNTPAQFISAGDVYQNQNNDNNSNNSRALGAIRLP